MTKIRNKAPEPRIGLSRTPMLTMIDLAERQAKKLRGSWVRQRRLAANLRRYENRLAADLGL